MRFPRALAIRDDLDIEDCLTASGKYRFFIWVLAVAYIVFTALLDSLRSGKKRKMETTKYVCYVILIVFFRFKETNITE